MLIMHKGQKLKGIHNAETESESESFTAHTEAGKKAANHKQ